MKKPIIVSGYWTWCVKHDFDGLYLDGFHYCCITAVGFLVHTVNHVVFALTHSFTYYLPLLPTPTPIDTKFPCLHPLISLFLPVLQEIKVIEAREELRVRQEQKVFQVPMGPLALKAAKGRRALQGNPARHSTRPSQWAAGRPSTATTITRRCSLTPSSSTLTNTSTCLKASSTAMSRVFTSSTSTSTRGTSRRPTCT